MSRRLALLMLLALAGCQKVPDAPAVPPAAAASAVPAPDAYALAATGHGFSTGPLMAAHVVYVFFDPTCPHCAHLWGAAQPLQARLKIVWLPIGLLRPSSGPQGATILSAADPAKAMAENEASVLARAGGIAVKPSLPADALDHVKANTAIFTKLGADSVPLIVYKNAQTGQFGTQSGAVDTAQLAALAGI